MQLSHILKRSILGISVFMLTLMAPAPAGAQTPFINPQPQATFDLVSGGIMAGPNAAGVIVPSPLPGPDYSMPDPGQVHVFQADPDRASTFPTAYGHLVASGDSSNAPQAVLTAGVDDRDNTDITGWAIYEHQSIAAVTSTASTGNLRVVDLFVETPGASPVFTVTYVSNSGSYSRPWAWLENVNSTILLNYVTANNDRIISQKVFYDASQAVLGDRERFYAVMIPNTGVDAKAWAFYKNQNTTDLNSFAISHTMRLTQVNSYLEGATTLYDAVLISNTGTDNRAWEWWGNQSPAFVSNEINTTGLRLYDMDIADPVSGTLNVILTSCPGGCPMWWWYLGVPTSNLLAVAEQAGARIIDANSSAGCSDRCWSFVMINNSNAITSRVGEMLRSLDNTNGTKGLYLEQIGGPVLANLLDAAPFEPASTIKSAVHLFAMRQFQSGTDSPANLVTKYLPPASGSCPGNTVNGSETADLTDREMMWHSDNTRTRELVDRFGRTNINAMLVALGMANTSINHIIGCGGPPENTTTLDDLARLYKGVATATFVNSTYRSYFFRQEAGKSQFKIEGYDWTGLWNTDIPAMINQEAPADMTAAVRSAFQNQMELAYKAGNYKICDTTCATYHDHISIFGYVKIPFCDAGGPREYVFGTYIYQSTSDTKSNAAFTATKAELLREQLHAGLASCNHQGFVKTYLPTVRK